MKMKLAVITLLAAGAAGSARAETTWAAPGPGSDMVIVADETTGPKSIRLPLPPLPPIPGVAWKGPFPVPSFLVAQNQAPEPPPILEPLVKQMRHDVAVVNENIEKLRMKTDGKPNFEDRLQMVIKGGGDRSIFVPASHVDEKVQAEIEEDLNIMGYLIGNAATEVTADKGKHRAMGIAIHSFPFGVSRNLQIEGYGALFEISVPFPLQPVDSAGTVEKPKPNASSWEEARLHINNPEWQENSPEGARPEGPQYDPDKIEALKAALLKALGNASNIRHMESKEFITIAVRSVSPRFRELNPVTGNFPGSEPPEPERGRRAGVGAGVGAGAPRGEFRQTFTKRVAPPGNESVLTIRVKKSDADALAKGDIPPEEFRKRALVVVN